MNTQGANREARPAFRRDDSYREEIHRRAALPFHRTSTPRSTHDLLVMNHCPDLAGEPGIATLPLGGSAETGFGSPS
jgi:hypothetical protein